MCILLFLAPKPLRLFSEKIELFTQGHKSRRARHSRIHNWLSVSVNKSTVTLHGVKCQEFVGFTLHKFTKTGEQDIRDAEITTWGGSSEAAK